MQETQVQPQSQEEPLEKEMATYSSILAWKILWTEETARLQFMGSQEASLSFTISRSLLKFMSIESVMPSNHLILCRPFLLLPPNPLSIRVFSNESTLRIRWPKYWSFSFSISPSSEYSGLISLRRTGWISRTGMLGP